MAVVNKSKQRSSQTTRSKGKSGASGLVTKRKTASSAPRKKSSVQKKLSSVTKKSKSTKQQSRKTPEKTLKKAPEKTPKKSQPKQNKLYTLGGELTIQTLPVIVKSKGGFKTPEAVVDERGNTFSKSIVEVSVDGSSTYIVKLDAEQTELVLKIIGIVDV